MITLFSLAHALISLFIKIGLGSIGKINIEQIKHLPTLMRTLVSNPFILLGFILVAISLFLYYLIVSRTKLSFAFLATRSLAYIFVIIFSWVFLGEIITLKTFLGIITILIGIYLIS